MHNAETAKGGIFTLYNGTTQSINVFFAHLEQKVGLCNVVKTAVSLGMTYANGGSLLRPDKALRQYASADNIPSFTLGAVPVAPMSMAAAYATVAARGIYCPPIAIGRILSNNGASLPVKSANCHRVLSTDVADAANYILQGVITSGTAAGRGIGVQAAGKTGTSDGGYYAAFGGYTPRLPGYVSVFNPLHPTTGGALKNGFPHTCYRENPATGGGQNCPGQMYGDNAPAATWQMTFMNANLAPAFFVGVPPGSPFFSMGDGVNSPKPPKPPRRNGHGGGGGGGGGHGPLPPLPTPPILPPPLP